MTWEYMSIHVEINPQTTRSAQLNELGKAGWELVAIIPIQDMAHHFRAFLKLPTQKSN
jgi:hypothetical protein